ncbi:hypothetical protein Dimus_022046 [Dionaea muscipula]
MPKSSKQGRTDSLLWSDRTTTINPDNFSDRAMTSRPPPASVNGDYRTHPPPHHHNQHNHYPSYSASSFSSSPSLKGCCCCLFLLFSFLALLVLAVVLVIVLAVKPKKPQFDLQQVGVQYVGITATPTTATSALTPSTASLSLSIRLLFMAANPNKVGIKYGESRFTVMYKGIPLGEGTVAGFYQAPHSLREVETVVAVDRVNLQQADATDLVKDASLNDRVELRVLGDVGAKVRIFIFDSPAVEVSIDCAIVVSPTKQSLTYKQCGFNGVNV